MWFDGAKAQDSSLGYFSTNTTFLFFFSRTPKKEYLTGMNNVVWAAAHNQFFALMAMPKQPAMQIVARPVALPQFSNVEQAANAPLPQGIQTALIYPTQTLEANSAVERQIVFFAGSSPASSCRKKSMQKKIQTMRILKLNRRKLPTLDRDKAFLVCWTINFRNATSPTKSCNDSFFAILTTYSTFFQNHIRSFSQV